MYMLTILELLNLLPFFLIFTLKYFVHFLYNLKLFYINTSSFSIPSSMFAYNINILVLQYVFKAVINTVKLLSNLA